MSIESEYSEKEFDITLESIYRQISIEEEVDIDSMEFEVFMEKMIDLSFNDKFKLIDTKELLSEDNRLLNISISRLVDNCVKNGYKKITMIFLYYCDYFNCDYHAVYVKSSYKIQTIIEKDLIKIIGIKRFNKLKSLESVDGIKVKTVFDIIKK